MRKKIKFLCFMCALFATSIAAMASAPSVLSLRFARTGTDASSVAISVVDQDGNVVNGTSATLTTSHAFKPTGSSVTEGVLCPNVNGSSSPTIVLTFNVSGLPESMSYNNVGLHIHALNGNGGYQQNADGKKRFFNVAISQGAAEGSLTSFADLSEIDIAAGVGTSGNVHKVWNAASSQSASTGNAFTLRLTITRGSENAGCFFGLSEITLSTGEAPVVPETPETPVGIRADAFYYIKWSQNTGLYMTEEADGSLIATGPDIAQRQFWQFVPTDNTDCYYIKNAATGRYIQSCNKTDSNTSLVSTGTTPVEYYIPLCETNGAAVKGCYRLTSTDCPNYDKTSSAPHGLNKDGGSSNIIVWSAGESQVGSWWKLAETENLFDLRPFNFSDVLGQPKSIYAITSSATGKVLQMAADGTLSWAERTETDNQTWYFVGTSNNASGFLIANVATGLTINAGTEEGTRWYVLEGNADENGYKLRPHASKDDAATTLTVEGESLVLFKPMRSQFSRAAQIYNMPCGAIGNVFVVKAGVTGGKSPMTYPLSTLSGTTVTSPYATKPGSWYTLYTLDKATVACGSTFTLNITLNQTPLSGQTAYVYFDWNHDGIFEIKQELDKSRNMTTEITVPADAQIGESRMRFRLTDNGLPDAEDDVTGQIIDFVIKTVSADTDEYSYSATSNAPSRGTAAIAASADGTELTATATPYGNASFLCWREGKNVVSAQNPYTFTLNHDTHLTAYFTPNTDKTSTGIDVSELNEANCLVNVTADRNSFNVQTTATVRLVLVYNANGQLMGRSETKQVTCPTLSPGTYIVKVFTDAADMGKKVMGK